MIKIQPSNSELNHALSFSKKYDEMGYGKNVLGVDYKEYIDFIRIGKLCELAFVQLLNKNKIKCICNEMLIPCKDEYKKGPDLILSHSGQEVDVKAANKSFHSRLLVREDQFKAHIHDIYVGAKYVNDSLIEFHGYAMGKNLEKIQPKDFGYGPCRHLLLADLEPVEKFIKLCIENRSIQ